MKLMIDVDKNHYDLISRSALKERGTVIGMVNGQKMKVVPLSVIDNAPAVSDRYDEGYAQGYIDGSTGADIKGNTK